MSLWPWRKAGTRPEEALYAAIVAAARRPRFYATGAVPDTLEGRFDMVVLHLALVVERLQGEGMDDLVRSLVERFVTGMDDALRELGASDVTVGKKVRRMAEAFYGRAAAYGAAGNDETALAAALARNLWPDVEPPGALPELARWLVAARAALAAQPAAAMAQGTVTFP